MTLKENLNGYNSNYDDPTVAINYHNKMNVPGSYNATEVVNYNDQMPQLNDMPTQLARPSQFQPTPSNNAYNNVPASPVYTQYNQPNQHYYATPAAPVTSASKGSLTLILGSVAIVAVAAVAIALILVLGTKQPTPPSPVVAQATTAPATTVAAVTTAPASTVAPTPTTEPTTAAVIVAPSPTPEPTTAAPTPTAEPTTAVATTTPAAVTTPARTTPAASASVRFVAYSDPKGFWSAQIPDNWKVTANQEGVEFEPANADAYSLGIQSQDMGNRLPDKAQIDTLIRQRMESFGAKLERQETRKLGGIDAHFYTASYTNLGVTIEITMIAAPKGTHMYFIYSTSAESVRSQSTPAFERVLASLKFK